MMKFTKILVVCSFVFLAVGDVFGQLYVKDSYVYVADNYLYVEKEIELNTANSNLYLRNGAQLLQKSSVAGVNKGLGNMSIYQEGTSNGFAYNYWCSPVGEGSATAGNSLFSINNIGVPNSSSSTTFTTPLPWGSPTGTSVTGAAAIASRWIYKFISSTTYAGWIHAGTANTIFPGEGFTMKGTNGTDATTAATVQADGTAPNNAGGAQRYDFRGKPNDGTITVPLAIAKQTLAGNPYPSAIDMQIFLSAVENPNCDGTAQYWEQPNLNSTSHFLASYKGGYGIYNGRTNSYSPAIISSYDGAGTNIGVFSTPGNDIKRKFCPVGQGFLLTGVSAATSTGVVTFKNTHRVARKESVALDSQFQRLVNTQTTDQNAYGFYDAIPNVAGRDYTLISKAPTPQIIFKTMIANDMVRQSSISFLSDAIDGVDRADSKSPNVDDNLPYDSYFALDNTEFVQTTTNFDINKKFALGLKNEQPATYKIKVAEIINFTGANEIYLHDKVNGLYYDIKNAAHEFSMPAGVNNTRYEITFTQVALSNPENTVASFDVYQNNANSLLTVRNPKLIDIQSCELFDITGKLVFRKTGLGSQSEFSFNTANLSEGIYIASIKTAANEKVNKKVIISKSK